MAPATSLSKRPNATPAKPNNTLYCRNLPDKLQKDDLKQALYMLFSTYGSILDIVALKTSKMRGQAHVLFRDRQASEQALRALQGYEFFGKVMNISYASSKSDTLAKLDGTFKQPEPAAHMTQGSDLQRDIFGNIAGETTSAKVKSNAPPALAPPPTAGAERSISPADANTPGSVIGIKRAREDSDHEDDAPMEEDDAAMEESDEE